jgi:hypothetical protein
MVVRYSFDAAVTLCPESLGNIYADIINRVFGQEGLYIVNQLVHQSVQQFLFGLSRVYMNLTGAFPAYAEGRLRAYPV